MRIVKEHFLREAARRHPVAARWLRDWTALTKRAKWRNWGEVNRDYPGTDAVRTSSGRTVGIFNVRRNEFRLIVAVHFNRQIAFTLRFLSHAEYGRSRWKDEL
ncbi:MAG: type II toxin-antitoxin system HigB family toxin [Verrucomicrobia bacterium]|nr:type II toxin-antitoxin system HigB family toxin [Verrucomicrobiota bacterium]